MFEMRLSLFCTLSISLFLFFTIKDRLVISQIYGRRAFVQNAVITNLLTHLRIERRTAAIFWWNLMTSHIVCKNNFRTLQWSSNRLRIIRFHNFLLNFAICFSDFFLVICIIYWALRSQVTLLWITISSEHFNKSVIHQIRSTYSKVVNNILSSHAAKHIYSQQYSNLYGRNIENITRM